MNAIQTNQLARSFGTLKAVDRLTLEIPRGTVFGFLGPNGAGKSTTMRVLTGYTPPTSGHAVIDGLDIRTDSFEVRRRIGYLPESNPLYVDMSVRGYLDFMGRIEGLGEPGAPRLGRCGPRRDRSD